MASNFPKIVQSLTRSADLKLSGEYRFLGRASPISTSWSDVFTTPVEVTSGRPCYNASRGYKINEKQTLADFFSRAFSSPVQTKLGQTNSGGQEQVNAFGSDSVVIGGGTGSDLRVSFIRTTRIPEDGKDYPLPPGLGRFLLFDMHPFRSRLPPEMAAQGGIFLPMYRELFYLQRPLLKLTNPVLQKEKQCGSILKVPRGDTQSVHTSEG